MKELSKIQQVGEKNVVDAQNGLKEFSRKRFRCLLCMAGPCTCVLTKHITNGKNAVIA